MHFKKFAIATVTALGLASTAPAETLTFVTSTPGGSWYPAGGAIKTAVEDLFDDIQINIRPGGGLANIKSISLKKADLGLSSTISAVDAHLGKPPFDEPVTNICNVAYLYPQVLQVPVRTDSGIESFEDFAGKRFSVAPPGTTAEQILRMVLESAGLTYDDLDQINFSSVSDQSNMMKDGQIDSVFLTTGVPASLIMDVGSARDLRLLPISDEAFAFLKEKNAGFQRTTIPGGIYKGMDEPVQSASFGTHVIADCDLDEEVVYKITKAIYERLSDLGLAVAALRNTTPEMVRQDVGIPQHRGSAKFFSEL